MPGNRIILNEYKRFLYHFIEELEDNAYYNQKWVWCEKCGRRHGLNSNIAYEHPVKPIPMKCSTINDHCWKYTGKWRFGYLDIILGTIDDKSVLLWLRECAIDQCIVCSKYKLAASSYYEPIDGLIDRLEYRKGRWDEGEVQQIVAFGKELQDRGLKLLEDYNLKFKDVEKTYNISVFNRRIREIQHIENYIIEVNGNGQ